MFKAISIEKSPDNQIKAEVKMLNNNVLPDNDTIVQVEYSTLNYKDCLAICNKSPVVRNFPMIPGIDFAGRIMSTTSKNFSEGDSVLLNGWGYGEASWGGLAEIVSVDSKHLLKIPCNMTSIEAMSFGTAGYTAMLAVLEIEKRNFNKNSQSN